MWDLEKEWTRTQQTIAAMPNNTISSQTIISLIDLTLLNEKATPREIEELARKANRHRVAAICVLPKHLDFIASSIKIKRATVANFPGGNHKQQELLNTLERIIKNHQVDEMDYVFPYQSYLEDHQDFALSCTQQIYLLCKEHGIGFKVILETGAFPSMLKIYQASASIIVRGCDFLKTSTGKIPMGATLPATFAMLTAIKESNQPCGIKLSGGIKTKEQAFEYLKLAEYILAQKADKSWFRIGASSLLDHLLTHQNAQPNQ